MDNINPQWIWMAAIAVAALVIIAFVASAVRNRRSRQLRDEFGSEYDHAVRTTKSRTKAERELLERKEHVEQLEIRPLTASERDNFVTEWQRIEARFIERPTTAVVEADELIASVMRARGYPVADFERRAAALSVNHPSIVENYRAAHRTIDSHTDGKATTEDLRQAMMRFRTLFEELVGSRDVAMGIRTESELDNDRLDRERPHTIEPEDRLRH